MNVPSKVVSVFKGFKGLISDVDSTDCPAEAMWRQLNLMVVKEGILESRGGVRELEFDILE